ncbi:MAG: nitroreductase family protein, partial [Clostridiales bacterium]|nr:nitroreductase family protein [Clostridiales bacterium]
GKADVLLPSLQEKFAKYPEIVEETRKFIGLLGKAPICILVFQYQESSPAAERTVVQSVSAAIENMLLMAYAKGIGSCWLTAPLDTGADAIFKERYAPDKGNMVALLTFGYPEKEGRMTRRRTGRYTII